MEGIKRSATYRLDKEDLGMACIGNEDIDWSKGRNGLSLALSIAARTSLTSLSISPLIVPSAASPTAFTPYFSAASFATFCASASFRP